MFAAGLVAVALVQEARDQGLDEIGLFAALLRAIFVLDRKVSQACGHQRGVRARRQEQRLRGVRGLGLQAGVVHRFGDETAHIRVHAKGRRQENAAVGLDGGRAVQQILQNRFP